MSRRSPTWRTVGVLFVVIAAIFMALKAMTFRPGYPELPIFEIRRAADRSISSLSSKCKDRLALLTATYLNDKALGVPQTNLAATQVLIDNTVVECSRPPQ